MKLFTLPPLINADLTEGLWQSKAMVLDAYSEIIRILVFNRFRLLKTHFLRLKE